jgi:hypothetical protein
VIAVRADRITAPPPAIPQIPWTGTSNTIINQYTHLISGLIRLTPNRDEKTDAPDPTLGQKGLLHNPFKKKFCPECGGRISMVYLQCPKCGIKLK